MKTIAILADFPWSFFDHGATGRGGGQACTWLTQIAGAFAESSGFHFHWLSIDRTMPMGKTVSKTWKGQSFTRIGGPPLRIDLLTGYRVSELALRRCLRRIKPDVIHCWGTERAYPVVCKGAKVPTILSMQGILSEYARIGSFGGNKIWTKMAAFEPGFLKSADVITCESKWGRDRVLEIAPDKQVRLIEYGVHPDFYKLQWNPDQENPYVLYVGSLDWRKGVDVLMDAAQLLDKRPWRILLAGDGPLKASFESRNVPGVEILGNCQWNRIQELLERASCLVLPTRADTSPNVVKEALVVGLPVITTPHGGQAGYVIHGKNGLIVDPLEPYSLADAMSRLMNDPESRAAMGGWEHDRYRDLFRADHTASGFIRLYHEINTSV